MSYQQEKNQVMLTNHLQQQCHALVLSHRLSFS